MNGQKNRGMNQINDINYMVTVNSPVGDSATKVETVRKDEQHTI